MKEHSNEQFLPPLQLEFKIVLKGIIGYSDYSFEMVIFECLRTNRIFVFFFKASHLCTLVVCLLVFYYIMDS